MLPRDRRPVAIALLVAGAFFMENLDGTVIATAMPQMARSFGASPVDLNIGMTAYLLALAVFIPMSGWLADRFGARPVFASAIGLFTASSVLCGLSNGLWAFTAARILQGLGGAMMVPVGRLVVLRTTAKEDLLRSIAYITWPGLAAPILGPPVGGFITTYASWRWIFLLNVPLGFLGVVLALWLIPSSRSSQKRPFDWIGFMLTSAACVTLMSGLDLIGRHQINWLTTGLLLVCSLAIAAFAVSHVRRHPHPLIDLSSLRVPTFAVTIWGGSLFRIAIGATPFLLPLMFQTGFGMNAFTSGLLVLAVFAGNLLMKPATTPVLRRFGFRTVLIANGLLAAVTILACALFTSSTPKAIIVAVLFAGGLFRSMQFTSLNTLGFADIHRSHLSDASTLSSMVQQMTIGMGIAVGAIVLRLAGALHSTNANLLAADDFRIAFLLVGVIALVSVIDSFSLPSNAGAEVSGRRLKHSPLRSDGPSLPSSISRPPNASSSEKGVRPVLSKQGGSAATLVA
jgi:EmrB/QacA subfamily drug resistance transporter